MVTFDLMRLVRSSFWAEMHRNRDAKGFWGFGDHVVPDFLTPGDYWIVKSEPIKIQGRYGLGGGWALHGLAFEGRLLNYNRLVIDEMWDGTARVLWNGRDVGSDFTLGPLKVEVQRDWDGLFSQAWISFPEVQLYIARHSWPGNANVNAEITMLSQPGGQDGHCGKGDGNLTDDTQAYLYANWGDQVSADELLFTEAFGGSALVQTGERHAQRAEDCKSSPPLPEAVALCDAALNGTAGALAEALRQGCLTDVCVLGPGAANATSMVAQREMRELRMEGAPEGWHSGDAWKSCDEACAERGLVCTEEELFAHDHEVDTSAEVLELVGRLNGNASTDNCAPQFGTATDVPNWGQGHCFHSEASRNLSTFDCAAKPRGGVRPKHRLCYCHAR